MISRDKGVSNSFSSSEKIKVEYRRVRWRAISKLCDWLNANTIWWVPGAGGAKIPKIVRTSTARAHVQKKPSSEIGLPFPNDD